MNNYYSWWNNHYIPESFNTDISHKLFDYKIICVISLRENINSKVDIVFKNLFERFVLKISGIQKYIFNGFTKICIGSLSYRFFLFLLSLSIVIFSQFYFFKRLVQKQ